MKRFLLLMFIVASCTTGMFAQKTVSGVVTDLGGEPLIGASVVTLEDSNIGTTTDFDGAYSLSVPDGTTSLVVSYIGYSDKTVDISSGTLFNIQLSDDTETIETVTVSGIGLKRNKRDVVYANQKVDAEDLLKAPNKNTLEALRGKVSGVKISTGSGSVGASTRIVLRGEGSLTGNNNALIVVDGIPIDNSASGGASSSQSTGYADYGNRFNDINPNDIESVTVLKGPAATSLYGSRGASGVLVIKTKSGGSLDKNTFKVGVSSTASVEQAYVLLQRQDRYGQGYGLPYADTPQRDSGENWSWGPAFDGKVRPWTSPVDVDGDGQREYLSRPYEAVENQLEGFFRLGNTFDNNINFSGSTKGFSYYASYGNTRQEGILDNTDYTRNTLSLAANAKLTDKLTSSFKVKYSNVDQNTAQEGSRPFEGQNAYANAVQSPVNIPFNELRDYTNPYHGFEGYYGSYTSNPYFILNEFTNNGKIDNFSATVNLNYEILKGLSIGGTLGANIVNKNITETVPVYAYEDHYVFTDRLATTTRGGRPNSTGSYYNSKRNARILDATINANYQTQLTEDISLNTIVGFNRNTVQRRNISGQTQGGLVVPGFYNFSNSAQAAIVSEFASNYEIRGLYGNASIGFQNALFLEYSARNDWSSTLPKANNSFFYQAVGASAILTDYLKLQENPYMNYLKLRTSYGTTGKDASLYALESYFIGNPNLATLANNHTITFPLNGQSGFTLGNRIGNPDLKPELTTTFEAGVDASFLDDRVAVEYTYYNSQHSNQLVSVNLPASTGYTSTIKNVGKIENRGHELGLTLRPIQGLVDGLTWDLNFNYGKNINTVKKISDEQDELFVGGVGSVSIVAKEGKPFGTFKGQVVKTNDDGQIVVGQDGLILLSDDQEYLSSYQPDFTASLGTNIGYKGLSFNVLFDVKQGGSFVSSTKDLTEFNGTALTTLTGTNGDRGEFVIPNSVILNEDGKTYSENTILTNGYDYLRKLPTSSHIIDASYIKLRELGVTYQVPNSLLKKLPVTNAQVRFFGKNLKFWLPEENIWADPEVNGAALTGNGGGIETTQTPPSKSYGVSVNLNF